MMLAGERLPALLGASPRHHRASAAAVLSAVLLALLA
jgi:hypothetical protein